MGEDYLNLYIGIAGLLISILGLVQALISSHFERWMKRFFLNETVINPPAELGRLTDARCGERSNR